MDDIVELYRRASAGFGTLVHAVGEDQWGRPTPCSEWDVRTLVNHLVAENLWVPPLFEGRTIADVGGRFDGDVLGEDPAAAWTAAAAPALTAIAGPGAMERIVHLSFGDVPGSEYAWELFADHLIHGWDLARGIGQGDRMDPDLVQACAGWFAGREELYRQVGAVGTRPEVPEGADPQVELLAAFGRRA